MIRTVVPCTGTWTLPVPQRRRGITGYLYQDYHQLPITGNGIDHGQRRRPVQRRGTNREP